MNTPDSSIESHQLTLAATCTLREAEDLKASLLACLEQTGNVGIDAGKVVRIDTAALQLLVAFGRDLADAGRSFQWLSASNELRAAAQALGLAGILRLPAAGAAVALAA